jgi:hypothetical protein
MLLRGKPITEITRDDLQSLISEKYEERRTLDYKVKLHGKNDGDIKEFLADVSSFANTSGGLILYGIQEDEGKPVSLEGCQGNPDAEQLRLENSIRDGLRPRIHGVESHTVPIAAGTWVLILGIPKSLAAPHMVTYKGTSRFYARKSNGKYQLEVDDIRAAFALSEDLHTRLRNWRLDRLTKIEGQETPVPLVDEPKVVVHVVPVAAFQSMNAVDIKTVFRSTDWQELTQAFGLGRDNTLFNLDGLLSSSISMDAGQQGQAWRYVQFFRDGIIEAVDAHLLRQDPEARLTIRPAWLEHRCIPACAQALTLLRRLEMAPPILVFWSMMGVRGFRIYRFPSETLDWGMSPGAIDRDNLLLPEVWLEEYPSDTVTLIDTLRVPFDALWNATGFSEWLTYQDCRTRMAANLS